MNQVICGNSDCEVDYALRKASKRAVEDGCVIWVYDSFGMFYMTDAYPPQGSDVIARCLPGGRIELKRKRANDGR